MKHLAFVLLLSTGLVVASPHSPSTAQSPAPAMVGQIRGVVLEGDRPQPALQVTLRNLEGQPVATRQTDLEGRFTFENVAAGSYVLSSAKQVSNGVSAGEAGVAVEANRLHEVAIRLVAEPVRPR